RRSGPSWTPTAGSPTSSCSWATSSPTHAATFPREATSSKGSTTAAGPLRVFDQRAETLALGHVVADRSHVGGGARGYPQQLPRSPSRTPATTRKAVGQAAALPARADALPM